MAAVFVEVWFEGSSLEDAGIDARDEIEDTLHDELSARGLGEVTGGGGGIRGSNVDINVYDARQFPAALSVIRSVLQGLGAPASTTIIQHDPVERIYGLRD